MPNGRAVLGGLLIAVAATGAYAVSGTGGGTTGRPYVVVARDVAPGTALTPADLRTELMTLPDGLAGHAFSDPALLTGRVVVAPLASGELVQAAQVLPAGSGAAGAQLSLAIDPARALDGSLLPGESVDVVATFGTGETATTVVVARGATVVSLSAPGDALSGAGTSVMTLALAGPDDALAVAHAAQAGTVTVVRPGGTAGTVAEYHSPVAGIESTPSEDAS